MFEYEQETYGSKSRERIRAAAMAHTGKKGKILLPPTRRQKAEGLDKVEVDVCFESARGGEIYDVGPSEYREIGQWG